MTPTPLYPNLNIAAEQSLCKGIGSIPEILHHLVFYITANLRKFKIQY